METNDIIDKLFDYFKVTSIQDLAEKMNVSQPTISKWKTRNAISAIKKRCRELGIYNEIFGDLNNTINISSELNHALKNSDKVGIDETTLFLFKEAYKKAKANNYIKELRIYLMEFEAKTEPFEIVEKVTLKDLENIVENMIEKKKNTN
ncbi:helix-turn-helix domain-containing protein [Aliarcobacter butzleri]|uniref:helix-turn-helix domain-containing protein n=1 Tax=Aliarcobacter butzleri TaxID=28197 RepID=UPI002B24880C|nr:helix-turn-helix domain-containing protein [Aliarcobacter butzleri]